MHISIKQTVNKLNCIHADVDRIKKKLVDTDNVLTADDLAALAEAENNLKNNKTKSL